MRRRRAIRMVEALIMGAAIRPRPVFVKLFPPSFRGAKRTRNLEIPGSMLRIAPE
jgi:hypothetical protein